MVENQLNLDWKVYILECSDGTLYTGICKNVSSRVAVHNAGKGAKYTRVRLPVSVRYIESGFDRASASKREYVLKQLSRKQKLALIRSGTSAALRQINGDEASAS